MNPPALRRPEIVQAFIAARDGLDVRSLYERVDALDGTLHGETQNALYAEIGRFLTRMTRWYVQNETFDGGLTGAVVASRDALDKLKPSWSSWPPRRGRPKPTHGAAMPRREGRAGRRRQDDRAAAAPALVPDIASVSRETSDRWTAPIGGYFGITRLFQIGRLEQALLVAPDRRLLRDAGAGAGGSARSPGRGGG